MPPLFREDLDELRTAGMPLVFTPRCHPVAGTMAAYVGEGTMQVECGECGAVVVDFAVASNGYSYYGRPVLTPELLAAQDAENARLSRVIDARLGPNPTDPACLDCGWAMSDHGDPPKCPPIPGQPAEGGSRR